LFKTSQKCQCWLETPARCSLKPGRDQLSEAQSEAKKKITKDYAAGGATYAESKDYRFMHQHGFRELISMEPSAMK